MLTKKILLSTFVGIVTAGISFTAQAATPGFYVGAQGGYGDTHFGVDDVNPITTVTSSNMSNRGLATRVFAGYQFDKMWAGEFGYTHFNDTRYRAVNSKGQPITGSIKEHALDLVGKATWPIGDQFNFYAKAGVAAVETYGTGDIHNDFGTRVHPTFGVGVSYEIARCVPIDVSWTRIQKWGGDIPNADFFAVGIGYKF